jgi:hypothetical protein
MWTFSSVRQMKTLIAAVHRNACGHNGLRRVYPFTQELRMCYARFTHELRRIYVRFTHRLRMSYAVFTHELRRIYARFTHELNREEYAKYV